MKDLLHIEKEKFFTQDKTFYKSLFSMLFIVGLQNIVAYSINMVDNIMLGSYRQEALAGATTVNQIFFVVQQITLGIGNALVILASQYWGKKRIEPIASLTGLTLKIGLIFSIVIVFICSVFSSELLGLFTTSKMIIAQGCDYLYLMQWSFVLFIFSNLLMATLRSVETVKIAFYISIVSLMVNTAINYTLIFGNFGFPEMGVKGAAIGTVVARLLELMIVVIYLLKFDTKINLFKYRFWERSSSELNSDYRKVVVPLILSQIFWAVSIPIQTGILGHLSDDAIVANSIATTFFQYLKVIVVAMASASSVLIGISIGRGDMKRIHSDARTMACIDIIIGIILAIGLYSLRYPLLSMYQLTDSATVLSLNLIGVMSIVMVGMSYQMPVSIGIIQGGGDTRFVMIMNLVSIWAIVIPLSFLTAFVWRWPVEWVVLVIQSDQIFKVIPTFIRFRSYKWVRKLAR